MHPLEKYFEPIVWRRDDGRGCTWRGIEALGSVHRDWSKYSFGNDTRRHLSRFIYLILTRRNFCDWANRISRARLSSSLRIAGRYRWAAQIPLAAVRSFHFTCNVITVFPRDCYVIFIFNTDAPNSRINYLYCRVFIKSKRANASTHLHVFIFIFRYVRHLFTWRISTMGK